MNKITLLTTAILLFWGCSSAEFEFNFPSGGALSSDIQPEKGVVLVKNTHPHSISKVLTSTGEILPFFTFSDDSLAILTPTSGFLDIISSQDETMIEVAESGSLAFFSDSLALGIVKPREAKYGIQELIVLLSHKNKSGEWVGFQPNSFRHYPYMDMGNGMGHGSNFNEPLQPMMNRPGWYLGKVAYSMPGTWDLHFILNEQDTLSTQIKVTR